MRVLPPAGDVPGKGEALWKSLYATTGDVLVFIDADLREFDAQFVVGLLGPVAHRPADRLRQGDLRPAAVHDRPVLPAGGGRVTELVARPLLNLYWPELAGFVQPLAGEYAARRALLEQLPFVSGYGVEIAMLDRPAASVAGLDAMAQVDLGRRVHRNQSDEALGRMAAQVILTLLSRLEAHGKAVQVESPAPCSPSSTAPTAAYSPDIHDVGVTERPPLAARFRECRRPGGRAWALPGDGA